MGVIRGCLLWIPYCGDPLSRKIPSAILNSHRTKQSVSPFCDHAPPAANAALGNIVSIWIRFPTGIAKTPLDPLDASSWEEFVKRQRKIMQQADVLDVAKPVNIFFREDIAGIRGPFQQVTKASFSECLKVSGKFYVTQSNDVLEKEVSVETLPDAYHSALFEKAAISVPKGEKDFYSCFAFTTDEQKIAAVSLHMLLEAGTTVVIDEMQVSQTALKTVKTAISMRTHREKGNIIIIGTPRLGASKLRAGNENDENKINSVLQIKRLDVVEILAYSEKTLDRKLTAMELAYLYTFTGGHVRELCSIQEGDIMDTAGRLYYLSYARDQHLARFNKNELEFMNSCVGQNESGARAPASQNVLKMLYNEGIVYAAQTLQTGDARSAPRYKISDPLLACMLKMAIANVGPKSPKKDVHAMIGVIVESAIDELLDRIAASGGQVKGVDLTGFQSVCISMKKYDVDTVMVKSNNDSEITDAIFINTKLYGNLLTDKSISNFMSNNVKSGMKLLPRDCRVTVCHLTGCGVLDFTSFDGRSSRRCFRRKKVN